MYRNSLYFNIISIFRRNGQDAAIEFAEKLGYQKETIKQIIQDYVNEKSNQLSTESDAV